MRSNSIKGSITALVTPFKKDLTIDREAYKKIIEFHISSCTDGLVICGTTGEAATMSLDEKIYLLQTAKDLTQGKIPLIFGTGGNCTSEVCKLTEKAKDFGADAVLVVTPYYNKPTQAGLLAHFTQAAASTDLPMILYNVPGRTGCNMLPETVLALAEIKNITGIKEASGNLQQAMEIIKSAPNGFSLYSGEDALNLPLMACGAKGTISVTANVFPKAMKQFNDFALSQHFEEAKSIHYKLLSVHKGLFVETNPIPVKAMLSEMGLIDDYMRLPLSQPAAQTKELVKKLLKEVEPKL